MSAAAGHLRGHNILVTGAGAGFGRAIALAAAAAGAQLLLLGRTPEKLEAVYDQVVAEGGTAPIIVPGDLQQLEEDGADELAGAIANEIGELHGLVHNAGELGGRVPLQYYSPSQWNQVLQVNLTVPFLLTRALLPLLLSAPAARVIFMSSSVGIEGRAFWGAYAVSKFGVEGLAQVLRDELANTSNIDVHVVNPGGMRTAMRAAAYPAEDPTTRRAPEDLAPAIVELLRTDLRDPRTRIELQPSAQAPAVQAAAGQDAGALPSASAAPAG